MWSKYLIKQQRLLLPTSSCHFIPSKNLICLPPNLTISLELITAAGKYLGLEGRRREDLKNPGYTMHIECTTISKLQLKIFCLDCSTVTISNFKVLLFFIRGPLGVKFNLNLFY